MSQPNRVSDWSRQYDDYWAAVDIIDTCRLQLRPEAAYQQLNRVRAYLSEQAAECVPWGELQERFRYQLGSGYVGADANKISRF